MTDNTAGWFNEADRKKTPSAKLKELNDSVKGEVVDKYIIDYVPFNAKEPERDRDGNIVKQLVVVLQTDLRDWEGVAKLPVDDDGNKIDPAKDDGRRAVYARKFTNIYSALGKAIFAAGAKDLEVGGKFGVLLFEQEDTGKGNPLNKFKAKYEPPAKKSGGDTWFDDASSGEADKEQSSGSEAAGDEEPPF